ncbi:MAG: Mu transposase domain-containing protein, partial [bacterium]
DHVLKVMRDAFEANGLPKRILADQGTQFKRNLGPGLTRYERVLHTLGVQPIFASKGRPKAKGKKERWYRFVQEDFLTEHEFRSLEDLNAKWQEWVAWYRHQHEHSSLGGAAPATRYARVKKRKPTLPLEDVFAESATRLVRKNASISYRSKVYPVDPSLMGRRVEVRAFNGRVRVFHGRVLVGTFSSAIDYRQRMLRRLQVRVVKADGRVKFQGKRYPVGKRRVGTRVEVLRSRGKVHVYLPRDKEKVFEVRRRYRRRS